MEQGAAHLDRSIGRPLAGFGLATAAVASAGSFAQREAPRDWYKRLRKPPFQPPEAAFAPVWTLLYGAMALSAARVWRSPRSTQRTRALRWWWIQLALSGAWTPLFFGLRNARAAFADLLLFEAALLRYSRLASKVDRSAARLMAPTIGWVAFAGVLNAEILRRNR